jgi:hydroxylamine reductase
MDMFCYQCEQTMKGAGCTKMGVCGKEPQVSSLMDLLLHSLKLNSKIAFELSKKGIHDINSDVFTVRALFATITNVNFDEQRFVAYLKEAKECENRLRQLAKENSVMEIPPSDWELNQSVSHLEAQAQKFRFDD